MQKNKKLKRNNRNRNRNQSQKFSVKKKLALAGLIGVFLIGAGAAGWLLLKKDEAVQLSQAEQREVEQVDSDRAKKEAENSRLGLPGDPLKDGDNDGGQVEPPSGGAATLGSPSFEQSGGVVKSSVDISGATGGNCVFNFSTEADRPVVKTVSLGGGVCSVSIPEVEFARLGEWQLVVNYEGKSVSKVVQIN